MLLGVTSQGCCKRQALEYSITITIVSRVYNTKWLQLYSVQVKKLDKQIIWEITLLFSLYFPVILVPNLKNEETNSSCLGYTQRSINTSHPSTAEEYQTSLTINKKETNKPTHFQISKGYIPI